MLYDQMDRDPDRRFMKTVVGANGILLCIGVPAIYWIWFLLGASGLPSRVADPQQFQSLVSPAALQVALFVSLTVVLGVQLIIAAVLMLTAPMGAARRRK